MSVFLLALLVRGAVFWVVQPHEEVLLQPDSKIYFSLAQGLSERGCLCYPDRPGSPDVERMPGYPLFLAAVFWLFGYSPAGVAAVQILIDSLCCVLIFRLGDLVWKGAGLLSGTLAAVHMGMVTYAHFILNDSLFLFFFLLFMVALLRFLRQNEGRWAAALGLLAGVGALIRPVVLYLPLGMAPFLFVYQVMRGDESWVRAAGRVAVMVALFGLCLSPWGVRNYLHYGRFRLSAQSGEHLLQYVVPFVWQYSKGVPFIEGMKKTNDEFLKRASQTGLDLEKATPFEISDFQVNMAMDYLESEPKLAILKAWFYGAAKNLFAPAIVDLSYLLKIERPHFFYTQGTTTLERAWHFLKGMRGWFGWAVMGSLVILAIARILQVWGAVQLMRRKRWEGFFFLLIIGYFLLVSGPVGYAKYRLPFEPILIVLLAIGIQDLYGRWSGRTSDLRREGGGARDRSRVSVELK